MGTLLYHGLRGSFMAVKRPRLGDDRLVLKLKMSGGNISTLSEWLHELT